MCNIPQNKPLLRIGDINVIVLLLDLIDDPDDLQLFLNLVANYESALLKYAFNLLNDYHQAEDVLQDVWIKLARNVRSLHNKEERGVRNYLFIAVKHRVIDTIEKERKINTATLDFLENMKDTRASKEIDDLATHDLVIKILKQIPDKYSDVLYLHLVVGFTEKEIADSLDIKINTLRQHIYRGRQMFAEIYERENNV